MVLGGALRYDQLIGDLLVRQPLDEERQHLQLRPVALLLSRESDTGAGSRPDCCYV
jgi:hypothetical protein